MFTIKWPQHTNAMLFARFQPLKIDGQFITSQPRWVCEMQNSFLISTLLNACASCWATCSYDEPQCRVSCSRALESDCTGAIESPSPIQTPSHSAGTPCTGRVVETQLHPHKDLALAIKHCHWPSPPPPPPLSKSGTQWAGGASFSFV